ncbi:hypothetical protein AURDEDRAFT_122415 [Auricularia subglabra TFB-10046 SS5]|nr:hypothetical protein AURDEDRAFT_122415 [Auricularia subglabra TFB-10046 SS5]
MSYHDNYVTLSYTAPGYTLQRGSYIVNEYKVTSGQDPKGHIAVGQVRSFDRSGSLMFSVGRKGSGDVANWFKSRIPPGQNTFGNNPDKLNFAFVGTLTIVLAGGNLNGEEYFSIPGASFAQGHTLAANNWWFGGQTCVRGDGDFVKCQATRQATGEIWHFTFLRGGPQNYNQVDVVNLLAVEPY